MDRTLFAQVGADQREAQATSADTGHLAVEPAAKRLPDTLSALIGVRGTTPHGRRDPGASDV